MLKGIDVSVLQGDIDWKKVKSAGIDFAMIKATQGHGLAPSTKWLHLFTDSKFFKNIEAAEKNGVVCGAYHFATFRTPQEAREEAEYFAHILSMARGRSPLWAACDMEDNEYNSNLCKDELTESTLCFMETVKQTGYKPMLYTNPDYLKYRFHRNAFADSDIWLAHWNVKKPMNVPNMQIWQYGIGKVDGINTSVDVNKGYFKLPADKTELPQLNFTVGGKYTIKPGDKYSNGLAVPARYVGKQYTIMQVRSDRILLGEISSWVKI